MHAAIAAEPTRKPFAPAFTAARRTRRSFFVRLRDEVAVLHTVGLDHVMIGRVLRITTQDARAFCPSVREKALRRNLTRRALNAPLHGRHAHIGGKTIGKRAKHLVEIVSAYTQGELLAEPGIDRSR